MLYTIMFLSLLITGYFILNIYFLFIKMFYKIDKIHPSHESTLIKNKLPEISYSDSYLIEINNKYSKIDELVLISMNNLPLILKLIMQIKNTRKQDESSCKINVNDKIGYFQIIEINKYECLLGDLAKPHLYLSYKMVHQDNQLNLIITSSAYFNTMSRKLFFKIIKLGHDYIMLSFSKGVAKLCK